MPLNKPSGNMYLWAWTVNMLSGLCRHGCNYCYVTHKINKMLKRLGNRKYDVLKYEIIELPSLKKPDDGKVIFVQSCGDLFGSWIPSNIIKQIIDHCKKYPENTYLFQTKNPSRFFEFINYMPPSFIFGTTIETNRLVNTCPIPLPRWCVPPLDQHMRLAFIQSLQSRGCKTMISIEPLLDFDLDSFVRMIRFANPVFVSIGGDSCNCGLDEPDPEKIRCLIDELNVFTEVRVKKNLQRLIK